MSEQSNEEFSRFRWTGRREGRESWFREKASEDWARDDCVLVLIDHLHNATVGSRDYRLSCQLGSTSLRLFLSRVGAFGKVKDQIELDTADLIWAHASLQRLPETVTFLTGASIPYRIEKEVCFLSMLRESAFLRPRDL